MVYIVFFILKYKANRNIKNMFEYGYWIYIYINLADLLTLLCKINEFNYESPYNE